MSKKTLWTIAIIIFVLCGVLITSYSYSQSVSTQKSPSDQSVQMPTIPVAAVAVEKGNMDVTISALGTITAQNTVIVQPRVNGLLTKVSFKEGEIVKAGEILAQIDPRPFQASLDQVTGQLQRDQALLANAKLDLQRYQSLLATDSIAKQQVDAQEALVKQYQGTVLADKGQVENAKLQLEFTRITAPVSGRLGLRQVDAGNMIYTSNANGLVVITQTQPISALFAIPSEKLPMVLEQYHAKLPMQVEAFDRNNKTLLATGKLNTLDNQIDTTTGTVKLKAEFPNTDNRLFPNQFVNISLRVKTLPNVLLIPSAAIQRGVQGVFVYVADAKENTVKLQHVTLGTAANDYHVVEKGLTAEELVVIDGADKLRNGSKVELSIKKMAQNKAEAGKGNRVAGTTAKDHTGSIAHPSIKAGNSKSTE